MTSLSVFVDIAGSSESAELAALRETYENRQHSTSLHTLKQHFQEAFQTEHAALLADIEHMQM